MGYKQPTPAIAGPLFKYAPSAAVIHCPGDKRYKLPVGAGFGWDSYSGGNYLNGEDVQKNASAGFKKRTMVQHPSERFLFAEGADMRGENIGSWKMANYGSPAAGFSDAVLGDSPAAFHINAATFSFADGHAESHRWRDGTTIAYGASINVDKDKGSPEKSAAQHAGNLDAIWIGQRYATPQNP